MRIAFIGAVEGSAIALRALIEAGLPPSLVVTLPPERARRHSDFFDLSPLARSAGSAIFHTPHINDAEALDVLRAAETDLSLVIGWSEICSDAFRDVAPAGTIGFHPAPLPHMRGRAVIPWTILRGETSTAATLFWIDEGMDSGPILLQERIEVSPQETARSLYVKQTTALARMLPEAVRLVSQGRAPRMEQDHSRATYCAKRTLDDGRIDWRDTASNIERLIRAVGDPYPGAFTVAGDRRLFIDSAAISADSRRYIGLPGQVQRVEPDCFVVACGDGQSIEVRSWRFEGRSRDKPELPRLHAKLRG